MSLAGFIVYIAVYGVALYHAAGQRRPRLKAEALQGRSIIEMFYIYKFVNILKKILTF